MRSRRPLNRPLLLVLAALLAVTAALPAAADAARPLRTAFVSLPLEPLAFQRAHDAGATFVRIYVTWSDIAPKGPTKPAGFNASDPNDPLYNWTYWDNQAKEAVSHGLQPIFGVNNAPEWTERGGHDPDNPGTTNPDPAELGAFARAIALHYNGSTPGVPRVRYMEAWNEPNNFRFLNPQWDGSHWPPNPLPSAELYRGLLNAFADGVRGAVPSDRIVAGSLAPFTGGPQLPLVPPLQFMRQLLCLNAQNKPVSGCTPVKFDIWAHQPYTSGDATHHAVRSDDVSLGDLGRMRAVLRAGYAAGNIKSTIGFPEFWITEFSWDSKPPDPTAVPLKLEARWISEALHQAWLNGVDLFTWFQIRDEIKPGVGPGAVYQSGLYFACDRGIECDKPKPGFIDAFRFPFVAYKKGGGALLWGRTPTSKSGKVAIQQRSGGHWGKIGTLRADGDGIFKGRLRRQGGGDLRALYKGKTSNPFSLKRPKDMPVNPFGGPINLGGRSS